MKNQRMFRAFLTVLAMSVLLVGTVSAQLPRPPQPHAPVLRQPYVPKTYQLEVAADTLRAAPVVGASGLSYRYVSSMGENGIPYVSDTDHLNRPIGLYIDPATDDIYVTEQQGRRLLRYYKDGTGYSNNLEMGMAGVSVQTETAWNDPRNVTLAPDGHIWVADTSRLTEYDQTGGFIRNVPEDDWNVTGSGDYQFNQPESISFDEAGHMFVADRYNHRVQVFNWSAGSAPVYKATLGTTGVAGSDINHLNDPYGVAAMPGGGVFISDTNNNRVLNCAYIEASQTWTCGVQTAALNKPKGIAFVMPNDLYVMDDGNGRIWKCVGTTCETFYNGISGTNLALDSSRNVYVTHEWDCMVDKIESDGDYAGPILGEQNICYVPDFQHFNQPRVEVDPEGNILILEEAGQRLSKFSPTGTLLWSKGTAGHDGWEQDRFNWPHGLDTDPSGNIYVADGWRVQIFNKTGVYQGTIGTPPDQPNPMFLWVTDVAVDPNNGNIYAVDNNRAHVLIFNSARTKIGQLGITDTWGTGNDRFGGPVGVDVDSNSNIYVTDWGNHRVQKFNSSRAYVKTFGVSGSDGIQHDQISGPDDVSVDSLGRVFVVDMSNNRVQVYDAEGKYLATIGGAYDEKPGGFQQLSDVSITRDGSIYTSELFGFRIQKFSPGYPGWAQRNINGFGDVGGNVITAMEVYNDQLYAAQANWEDGSSLWRSADGRTWTQVLAPGVITDASSKFIIDLQIFDGKLYAAAGWGEQYARLWRYDGTTWEKVLEQEIPAFLAMTVFNNALYVGDGRADDGGGASIWKSTSGNSGSWSTSVTGGNGNPNNVEVRAFGVFQDRLYASTHNDVDGMEVWQMATNGLSWQRVVTGGLDSSSNDETGGMAAFDGALYVGVGNDDTGGKVFRTSNGTTWETVVTSGFNDPLFNRNTKIQALLAYKERLYAVTKNGETGAEIWSTSDGVEWQPVMTNGFGDSPNGDTGFGNATLIFRDRFYTTMVNTWKGAQIWEKLDLVFLPSLRR